MTNQHTQDTETLWESFLAGLGFLGCFMVVYGVWIATT